MADGEWIEIQCNRPSSRMFVRPTSYVLLEPEERERKWAEDVANNNYPANLWIKATEAIAKSERPHQMLGSL